MLTLFDLLGQQIQSSRDMEIMLFLPFLCHPSLTSDKRCSENKSKRVNGYYLVYLIVIQPECYNLNVEEMLKIILSMSAGSNFTIMRVSEELYSALQFLSLSISESP